MADVNDWMADIEARVAALEAKLVAVAASAAGGDQQQQQSCHRNKGWLAKGVGDRISPAGVRQMLFKCHITWLNQKNP
jgi:hypothetical protein